jgi:ParB family chromosome partitioning protein
VIVLFTHRNGVIIEKKQEGIKKSTVMKRMEKKSAKGSKSNDRHEIIYVQTSRIIPLQCRIKRSISEDGLLRLSDSIMRYGMIEPLIVRATESTEGKRKSEPLVYELISGERRWRAAKMVGLTEVPCICIEADDRHAFEISITDNIGREGLSFFDEANAMATLIDVFCLTQDETAGVFGIQRSSVASKLRLLRLTPQEKLLILASGLSEKHVRAFLKICDPEKRLEVLKEVTRSSLSVEQTEALIDKVLCPVSVESQKSKRKIGIKDARLVYNTIDRAVESIESIGVPIEKTRREDSDTVEFILKIKKPQPLKPTSTVIENPKAV